MTLSTIFSKVYFKAISVILVFELLCPQAVLADVISDKVKEAGEGAPAVSFEESDNVEKRMSEVVEEMEPITATMTPTEEDFDHERLQELPEALEGIEDLNLLAEIIAQAQAEMQAYEGEIAIAYSQAFDDIKKKANEAEQLEAELSARLKEKDSEIDAINSQAATNILRKTNEVRQLESDLVAMLEEKEQERYYVCRNARDEMLRNIRVDLLNRSRDRSKLLSIVSRIKSFRFQIITERDRIKREKEQIKAELGEKIKNRNKEIKDIETKAMADIERIVKEKEQIKAELDAKIEDIHQEINDISTGTEVKIMEMQEQINSLQLEVVNLAAKIAEIKVRHEEEVEADSSEEASFIASSPGPKEEPQKDVLSTIISEAVEVATSVSEVPLNILGEVIKIPAGVVGNTAKVITSVIEVPLKAIGEVITIPVVIVKWDDKPIYTIYVADVAMVAAWQALAPSQAANLMTVTYGVLRSLQEMAKDSSGYAEEAETGYGKKTTKDPQTGYGKEDKKQPGVLDILSGLIGEAAKLVGSVIEVPLKILGEVIKIPAGIIGNTAKVITSVIKVSLKAIGEVITIPIVIVKWDDKPIYTIYVFDVAMVAAWHAILPSQAAKLFTVTYGVLRSLQEMAKNNTGYPEEEVE